MQQVATTSCGQQTTRFSRRAQRGVALLAVMLAVVVAFILSTAFVAKQSTAVAIGENKQDHAVARGIAESAIEWGVAYLNQTDGWRSEQVEGAWFTDETLLEGEVTLYVYDGEDEDGDGIIDSDGDLADDAADKVTLIAVAKYDGLRHEVRTVVQPAVEDSLGTLLLLVGATPMSSDDAARKALFESWGWTVMTLEDRAPTEDYNVSLALADVVYFSEDCLSTDVGSRLAYTNTIGIVNEETHFNDDLKISSKVWINSRGEDIDILGAAHYITEPFASGDLQITSGTTLCYANSTVAPGAVHLANRSSNGSLCFLAIEVGSELVDGSLAAGRRVTVPYGSNNFAFTTLTEDGQELIKRSLYWASRGQTSDHLVAHWKMDHTSGQVAVDSSGNGNHAQLTNVGNGADWVFGVLNNAIDFDGAGLAYGRAPDSDSLDLEHEGTIAAWIKPEAITNFMGIVHKGELTNWTDEAYSLQFWTGRKLALTFHTTDGGSARCYGNQALNTDTWYHVVGTWNSAGMRIYVDGQLDASNTEEKVAATSDGSVQIGSQLSSWYNSSYKNLPFTGLIDDVRIYNRSLIESEIQTLYEAVASPAEAPTLIAEYTFHEPQPLDPQLVGHWPLDESIGSGGSAGVYVQGDIYLKNQSRIRSYDSTQGAYGGANVGAAAVVVTNATGSSDVYLQDSFIDGDVRVGAGADPNDVVHGSNNWAVSGTVTAQASNFALPTFNSPVPGAGSSYTFSGGSHTLDSDQHYDDLTLQNGAVVTIDGDVTLHVSDKLRITGGGIQIPDGASLTIHLEGDLQLQNGAYLNQDSEGTDRLTIWQYGSGQEITLESNNTLVGAVYTQGDVDIRNQSVMYGSLVTGGNLDINSPNGLRVDLSLAPSVSGGSGAGVQVTAVDKTANQDGQGESIFAGTGILADAYRFDGTSSFLLLDHHALQTPDDGTLALWFKVDELTGVQGLASKDSASYDDGGHITVYTDGGNLKVSLESSLTGYDLSTTGLVAGQWHHAAVSFGAEGAKLYLDGVLRDDDVYNGGLGTSSGGQGNTEPWVFGASTAGSGNNTHTPLSNYFKGELDDIRIYDAQVSQTQLSAVIADTALVAEPRAIVEEISGYGGGMDLVIGDLASVQWVSGGGLDILSPTTIGTADASVLYDALTATDEFTLELVYTPADTDSGDKALAGMLSSESALNMALFQDENTASGFARTSSTGSSGSPAVSGDGGVAASISTHLILSYDGEEVRLYQDGSLVASEPRTGGLSWSLGYGFYLGSLPNGSLPLEGRLTRVAVYDKGINLLQAQNVFLGKQPGLPSEQEAVSFTRRWQERFP